VTARCEKELTLLVALVTILVMPTLFAGSVQAVSSSALRMWSEAPNVVVNAGETADFTIALAASTLFSITVSFSIMDLRLSMVKKLEETPVVSDPEIYRNLREDPRFQQFETSKSAF